MCVIPIGKDVQFRQGLRLKDDPTRDVRRRCQVNRKRY